MKKVNRLRSVLTFAAATSLLIGVYSVAALGAVEWKAPASSTAWNSISEEYYSPVLIDDKGQVLLRKNLQQDDYKEILEKLVDTSIPADTAAITEAATNPNAHLPDNMLPDGRVLRSDWQTVQERLISNAQAVTALRDSAIVEANAASRLELMTECANYRMKVLTLENQRYVLPENSMKVCEVLPQTRECVFYDDSGIWLLNPQTMKTNKILPSEYNGKTYKELSEDAAQIGNTSSIVWSNQVCANEAGTMLAYISNKENLLTYSVFMYDIETGEEKLVQVSDDHNYLMIGWVNESTVLCYKLRGQGLNIVAIDSNGNELPIVLATDEPHIIDVSKGRIAYRSPGSNDLWISKYTGEASTDLELHMDLKGGVICVMAGADEFSPSGNKFAFIYSPSASSQERHLWTIDLDSCKIMKDSTLPTINSNIIGVHNFAWKNDSELIVNVYAQDDEGNEAISTWNYEVRGGGQNVSY